MGGMVKGGYAVLFCSLPPLRTQTKATLGANKMGSICKVKRHGMGFWAGKIIGLL
jgi:hypothetical protein